jgi:hypothetical protein
MLEKTEMNNEEWIIQRHRQHWEHDTDNIGNMTQRTKQDRKIKRSAIWTPPKKQQKKIFFIESGVRQHYPNPNS